MLSSLTRALAIGAAATVPGLLLLAGSSAASTSGCPSFASQADAQEHFTRLGGGPARDAAGLDDDRDGVACEELPGPYEGFATIGYNLKRKFLYGTASMPSTDSHDSGFACLYGNRHFEDGPRLLKIYRAEPGADRVVSRDVGAEAKPGSGRLVWKVDKDAISAGRYYVVFEAQIRPSPYRPSECPAFRSGEIRLP